MAETHSLFDTLQSFTFGDGQVGKFYSLPQLEKAEVGPISKLPVSLRIVLESVLRNYDGKRIREADVCAIANWEPNAERTAEIPFVVARVVLQDFTGVPLLVDLAAMRSTVSRMGRDAGLIEPLVPVDLIVDHSVQVDYSEVSNALQLNMEMEFKRNRARYQFLKWGMQAFNGFSVVPPGIGIIHQVNLEYLAKGVLKQGRNVLPRYACRHGLAHDHDQRPGHRRLGRRRHRSGGGDARPARVFPDAGRGGRQSDRCSEPRRDGDRPGADHSPKCSARRRSSASSSSSTAKARRP